MSNMFLTPIQVRSYQIVEVDLGYRLAWKAHFSAAGHHDLARRRIALRRAISDTI